MSSSEKISYFKTLKEVVSVDRNTLSLVALYGLVVSILFLSVPIAVQTLVNMVSIGATGQPIYILSLLLMVLLTAAMTVRILQTKVVENIQQKIFVDAALKLSNHLSRLKLSYFRTHRIEEMVNRIFEIVTVQKSISIIFLTVLEIILQSIASMVLLAFYHPILLAFDIVLVISIFLAIFLPFRRCLRTAVKESTDKHNVVGWLEEQAENPMFFRLKNNAEYGFNRADGYVQQYLTDRQAHFKGLMRHYIWVAVIYVLANTALLSIGGYLVSVGQLSLGQLVAAELLVNVILTGLLRLSGYLEEFYDLAASLQKIASVMTLSQESFEHEGKKRSLSHIDSVEINFPSVEEPLQLHQHKAYLVVEHNPKNTHLIADGLLSMSETNAYQLKINGEPVEQFKTVDRRKMIYVVRDIELFSGTILDNLVTDPTEEEIDQVYKLIEVFGLSERIQQLEEGLYTTIAGQQLTLGLVTQQKIMMIRAIMQKPDLIVLEYLLDIIAEKELEPILKAIKSATSMQIIFSQNHRMASYVNHIIEEPVL